MVVPIPKSATRIVNNTNLVISGTSTSLYDLTNHPGGLLMLGPDGKVPLQFLPASAGGTGGSAPATTFTFTQPTNSTTWVVDHNLGRHPIAVSLYDNTGVLCDGYQVTHPQVNRLIVSMDVPTRGTLYVL